MGPLQLLNFNQTNIYKPPKMYKFLVAAIAAKDIVAQEAGPEARKYSHIVKMVVSQITTQHDSKTVNKMLQNYGCHCFLDNSRIAGGSGPAQDDYDSLCKTLARCHKCIEMDYGVSAFSQEWDDNIGKYRWQNGGAGSITCNDNDDQFKTDLCACDAAYAMALGAVWDDSTFNKALWGNRKNQEYSLDVATACVSAGGAASDQCCGSYPARYPFVSGDVQCCENQQIFNPLS